MKQPSLTFVLLLAIMVRAAWLLIGLQQPSSDDLQYALMAEAIRHHQAFPLVAWGIGYGGTITTSWVLAGLFILLGQSLGVVLAYGAVLSLVQLILWMKIAKQLHPGSEGWVGLLLAVPSAHMGIMMQQLSYADALVIGALVVWCVVRWSRQTCLTIRQSFILGVLVGYLFYTHPIPTVFAAALLAFWRMRIRLALGASFLGLCVGVFPLVLANILMRGITIRRIGARILNMNASQLSQNSSPAHLIARLVNQVWTGLTAQPRLIMEAFSSDLGLTLIGIAATFALLVLLAASYRSKAIIRWVTWPIIVATLIGNMFLGENGRARFLMPAYTSSVLLAGTAVTLGGIPAQSVALSLTMLNAVQSWQRVRQTPAGVPYQAAINYLRSRRLRYGYADFWQSLPLTFLSKGELQVASTATDAKGFWDRTVPITARVDQSPEVFYVFNLANAMQRQFAQAFEVLAASQHITCDRANIPPLRIYSQLSRAVRPGELDAVYRSLGFVASGQEP